MDTAADVMNRRGAVEIEETSGPEPQLPGVVHENMTPMRNIRSRPDGSASRAAALPYSCGTKERNNS